MSTDRMRLTESPVPSDVASLATSDLDAQIKSESKQRRSVTQNACKECRKGRAKCSGAQPCSRCVRRDGAECIYEIPTKDKMKLEINRLRDQIVQYDRVLRALTSEETANSIQRHLIDGKPLESILSPSLATEAKSTLITPGHLSTTAQQPEMCQSPCNSTVGSPSSEAGGFPGSAVSVGSWTRITQSRPLIEHLLSLYFCWEYPVFTIISEHYFRNDMRDGRRKYCSPLLVNAILAVACRLSDRPEPQNDSHSRTAGDDFFKEAEDLLARDSTPDVTTVQALGIMSNREASFGREDTGWMLMGRCAQMAIHLGLHLPCTSVDGKPLSPAELEVRTITFWGFFALDQAWAQCTGRSPRLPYSVIRMAKLEGFKTGKTKTWTPYTDDEGCFEPAYEQPTNICSVFVCFCELSELISKSSYLLHCPKEPIPSKEVLALHTHYLLWYDSLPPALRRGQDFTPAVLALHMYYHFAIIVLFRPFFKVKFLESAVSPRTVCIEAADSISALLSSYANLYTLRRMPSLVSHVVLASTTIYLANVSDAPINEPLRRSLNVLKEVSIGESFVSHTLKLIGTAEITQESSGGDQEGSCTTYPV